MATHYKFEHDFDIDANEFWELFFSEDYNKELYIALRVDWQLVELKDEGKTLRRTIRATPKREVPAILRSFADNLGYTERDVLDRDRSEMQVVIEPGMSKDRFDMRAVYSVKSLGPGRCRRTFEGDTKVSIPLVGGKIEKFMVDEMRDSYEVATRVTRDFIQRRKAAKPAG